MKLNLANFLVIIYLAVYAFHFTIVQFFLPDLTNIYYAVTIFCLILLFPSSKAVYILWPLILVSILSMVVSSNLLPNTEYRWISWLIVVFVGGPTFVNYKIINFRKHLWLNLIRIYSLITIISFFWILLRLPNFGVDEMFTNGGKYFRNGISSHEMALAPMAGITGLFALYNFITHNSIVKILSLFLFFIAVLVIFMASSRTVIIAFLLTIAFSILINFKLVIQYVIGNTFRLVSIMILALLIISLNIKSIDVFLNENSRLKEKGTLNSRQSLIDARLNDFEKSPILGVGFYSVSGQYYNRDLANKGGQIEFGSLYLQVISTMGILGIITLSVILFNLMYIGIKTKRSPKAQLHFIILLFLLLHSITEAYAFSSGGVLCMFFWLSIFQVYCNKYEVTLSTFNKLTNNSKLFPKMVNSIDAI